MRPTYRKQFEKVSAAYHDGIFDPYDSSNDFWGCILNHEGEWGALIAMQFDGDIEQAVKQDQIKYFQGYVANPYLFAKAYVIFMRNSGGMYTVEDVLAIEKNFVEHYIKGGKDEGSLYYALSTSLEMLRALHQKIGRGKVPKLELVRRNDAGIETQIENMLSERGVHIVKDEPQIPSPDDEENGQ